MGENTKEKATSLLSTLVVVMVRGVCVCVCVCVSEWAWGKHIPVTLILLENALLDLLLMDSSEIYHYQFCLPSLTRDHGEGGTKHLLEFPCE